jgi:hypothetical protein
MWILLLAGAPIAALALIGLFMHDEIIKKGDK